MVQGVLQRLYKAKVLARSVNLVADAKSVVNSACDKLDGAACSTSALCWVDPADHTCKTHSVGHQRFHRVPTSTITSTSTTTKTTTSTETTSTTTAWPTFFFR